MDDIEGMKHSSMEEYPEDNLDVEIVDLDTLDDVADEQASRIPPWSSSVLRWQHSFNRKRLRVTSALCSLILVLLVIFLSLHNTLLANVQHNIASLFIKPLPKLAEKLATPVNIEPSLVISPTQAGFSCIVNEAWSPDSKSIALLGYSNGCLGSENNEASLVTIQNAHTGKRIAQMRPGGLILQTFHAQFPRVHDAMQIVYKAVLWSPDGLRLALLFDVVSGSLLSPTSSSRTGLLLFNESGKTAQVLLQEWHSSFSTVKWDTMRGKAVPISSVVHTDPESFSSSFPVGNYYMWDEKGDLAVATMVVPRPTTIGNPDGDALFSIQQPGIVFLDTQNQQDNSVSRALVYVWYTQLTAWSPDGRYLTNGSIVARLEPQGQPRPDYKTLLSMHLDKTALFPVHDAALESILKILVARSEASSYSAMVVSWCPDGRLLGAASYQDNGLVSIYASNTGYKIATLLSPKPSSLDPSQGHTNYFFAFNAPQWSQDGLQVFMQDPISNAIAVWSVARLRR